MALGLSLVTKDSEEPREAQQLPRPPHLKAKAGGQRLKGAMSC